MYTRKTNPFAIRRRNREILEKRLSGRKLEDIAKDYGITRERVRQVVNFTLACLPDEERQRAEGLMAVNLRGGIERHLLLRHQEIGRRLRELFKTEFHRKKILEITGTAFSGTDLELCYWLYGKYRIKNFFQWRRCWRCKEIKVLSKTFRKAALCTPCNTERHTETMRRNPGLYEKARAEQRKKPNYMRLCCIRYYLRKRGRLEEMPPLPPKGTPDWQIKIPKLADQRSRVDSVSFRRDNRAKRLVIEEARSRGIDAEL